MCEGATSSRSGLFPTKPSFSLPPGPLLPFLENTLKLHAVLVWGTEPGSNILGRFNTKERRGRRGEGGKGKGREEEKGEEQERWG